MIFCQHCNTPKKCESGLCPKCARFGIPITCGGCGYRFIPVSPFNKYCTPLCNGEALRLTQESDLIHEVCGNPVTKGESLFVCAFCDTNPPSYEVVEETEYQFQYVGKGAGMPKEILDLDAEYNSKLERKIRGEDEFGEDWK